MLDTSVLIRFARGNRTSIERIATYIRNRDRLASCDVTIVEFYSGSPYGSDPRWDALMDSLEYWPTSRAAAMQAASFRLEARRRNRTLALPDVIVAAVAAENNAILLTANPRDFQWPGLRVESVP